MVWYDVKPEGRKYCRCFFFLHVPHNLYFHTSVFLLFCFSSFSLSRSLDECICYWVHGTLLGSFPEQDLCRAVGRTSEEDQQRGWIYPILAEHYKFILHPPMWPGSFPPTLCRSFPFSRVLPSELYCWGLNYVPRTRCVFPIKSETPGGSQNPIFLRQ